MSTNTALTLAQADFARALHLSLPPGDALPDELGTDLDALLNGFADLDYALHARSLVLSETESAPDRSLELLPLWEECFGLPDPCAGEAASIELRQAQVKARANGQGGQSRAYFIGYAADLGYTITITEFTIARYGEAHFGDPLYDASWQSVWQINAPLETIRPAQYGISHFGDPYIDYGNEVLECEMRAIQPAHTLLLFHYS